MFAKPYKIKSNNTLKNSEKKHLIQRIEDELPLATPEIAKGLIPIKSVTACVKITTYNGDLVHVYTVDGTLTLLEIDNRLIPALPALWQYPQLLHTISIHAPVLQRLQGGAALFSGGVSRSGLPLWARGAVLAVRAPPSRAAAAVGRALISSADLMLSHGGACLEPLHVWGDQLCNEARFSRLTFPATKEGDFADEPMQQEAVPPIAAKEEWPALGRSAPPAAPLPPAPPSRAEPERIDDAMAALDLDADPVAEMADVAGGEGDEASVVGVADGDVPSDMDGLLRYCLLSFLKYEAKKIPLPLKTNLLYKNHLIPLCPEGRTLDVKKSSYKKMSKFLEAMQAEGLVELRELERGVWALVGVGVDNPAVRAHSGHKPSPPPAPSAPDYQPPQLVDVYCVTAAVLDVFAPHKKGAALSGAAAREAIGQYVKAKGLASATPGRVRLDQTLAAVLKKTPEEEVKWDELMGGVVGRMTAATELRHPDGSSKLIKSRLPPVKMDVVTRSGNKKVTLVSNLEGFGLSASALARAARGAAAASCAVTRTPGAAHDQLLLQGDQTHFVAKLLIEKYGLPKKYLEGADKALNKKK